MSDGAPYRSLARRFGLGRNSLRRGSDRLETAVLRLALILSLLALPVGAAGNPAGGPPAGATSATIGVRPVVPVLIRTTADIDRVEDRR